MVRDRVWRAAALVCALGGVISSTAWAQDASAQSTDAAVAPGPVDPQEPLPNGHPPINGTGDPHGGGDPTVHRAALPESFAEETPGIPAGTILVRVVDGQGNPVPEAMVHIGSLREGEPAGSRDVRTGPDGIARVEGLDTSQGVAYRVSSEYEGAKFGATPFTLSGSSGYRVQIARTDVDHTGRAVFIWDARVMLQFKDDRLVVVERVKIVNLSAMSLTGDAPHPTTYVPTEGLRFGLPAGWTAFTPAPSMSDMRLTTEGNDVVFRGSVPPTSREPMEVVFQYHVKLSGAELDLRTTLPISLVTATVLSEAPPGLTLSVEGMPAAETREAQGERILITGLERRPSDPQVREIKIHLGGIPAAAGWPRIAASAAALLLVLGALRFAWNSRAGGRVRRARAVVETERDRVLGEMAELVRLRAAEEVGPVTYQQRRRELALWLASVLKELDEAPSA